MGIELGGFFGLLLLIADIYAIVNVVRSNASTFATVVWVLLIIVLPLVGFLAWLIFGPRQRRSEF